MAAKAAKKIPKKKALYQMPETIPVGEILTDIMKKQWILGKSIGVGGFGEVYSAAPYSEKTPEDYNNVIKIEPHENGPLFVEMHFYMKNCKPDDIDNWQRKKKLAALGMPRYIASGSHEYKKTKYRFLVINRYGKDLQKIFEENNKRFPEHIVYKLALQIIDILEYIHHKDYIHADIKSENLLLDLTSYDQVYLVDFGLASRCTKNTKLKADPKKAHNGTLQYTSRDAHIGVSTQRGDLEILGYNIIFWLCGSLPWDKLDNAVTVQKEKEKAFENIKSFLDKCFLESVPQAVQKFMTLLASLKFNETPCYEKFKEILIAGLKMRNHKPDGKLGLKNIDVSTQPNSIFTSPKVKKPVGRPKNSPRTKQIASSSLRNNSRDSTIGVVIDKKRGNKRDIKKVLEDIDPDGEYDIKIVQKTKTAESNDNNKVSNEINNVVPLSSRKKINYIKDSGSDSETEQLPKRSHKKKKPAKKMKKSFDDSETASEPEIISKGTKSRPGTFRKKVTTKSTLKSSKMILSETQSDEDMFDT